MNGICELRAHERFRLDPMYTAVRVQRDDAHDALDGHAYDVSEAGLRFELDEPLAVGEIVRVGLHFPGDPDGVAAHGRVVWVNAVEDDPGPRRMAVSFTAFDRPRDRRRLIRRLGTAATPTA